MMCASLRCIFVVEAKAAEVCIVLVRSLVGFAVDLLSCCLPVCVADVGKCVSVFFIG